MPLTFADIPSGESVFLDANTLVYYFSPDPSFGQAAKQLLERIEQDDLTGFTSTHIVGEMAHRLMTLEAEHVFGCPHKGIVWRLRNHPGEVKTLTSSQTSITHVSNSKIQVIPITLPLLSSGAVISRQTGLLTNDALIIAMMQANGILNLASGDSDFDRVPGIQRFGPA